MGPGAVGNVMQKTNTQKSRDTVPFKADLVEPIPQVDPRKGLATLHPQNPSW